LQQVGVQHIDDLMVYLHLATLLILERNNKMSLQIKGLGDSLQAARKAISDVRGETAGLHEDTQAFIMDVRDVRTQIKKHHDDLKFEVATLGNGAPEDTTQSPSPSGQQFPVTDKVL